MQKVEYRVAVSQDRRAARIETVLDGEVQAWSDPSAEDLSGIIDILIATRAKMLDEVPRDLEPGARLPVTPDPIWRADTLNDGHIRLRLRHPGAGWLEFQFPPESSAGLVDFLTRSRQFPP